MNIEELLDRVEKLEALLEANETLSPNYLTFDPTTGVISGLFTGGLQLIEGDANFPVIPGRAVAWLGANGAIFEFIQASRPGGTGNHQLSLEAQNDQANTDTAELVLTAAQHTGVGFTISELTAIAQDNIHGAVSRRVIASDATSDFLQIGGEFLSVTGTTTLTWPAANSVSNAHNIKLSGATGTVRAVALPVGAISGTLFIPTIAGAPDGAGGVNFTGQLPTGAAAPGGATVDIAFIMWGN